MSYIQIELDDREEEILRTYMWLIGEDNKKSGLKKLIVESENIPKIKRAIEVKNRK